MKRGGKARLNIHINFTNRFLYTFVAFIALLVIGVTVFALTPGVAPNPGHLIDNVAPPAGCGTDQVLKWGGSDWTCADDISSVLKDVSCPAGQFVTGFNENGDIRCDQEQSSPPGPYLFYDSRSTGYGQCVVNNAYTTSYTYPTNTEAGTYRYEWRLSSTARYHFTVLSGGFYKNGALIYSFPKSVSGGTFDNYFRYNSGTQTGNSGTFTLKSGDTVKHIIHFSSRFGYECKPIIINAWYGRVAKI